MNNKWTKTALSALLVLGALGALSALGTFNWQTFAASLRGFNSKWVVCAVGVSIMQVFWQLLRFWVTFHPDERPPTLSLLRTTSEGQLLNYIAPLRSGDAYKVFRLATLGVGTGTVLAALLAERVADTLSLLVLAAYTAGPYVSQAVQNINVGVRFPSIALGIFFAAMMTFLIFGRDLSRRLSPKVQMLKKFLNTLGQVLRSRRFVMCVAVAGITWIFDAGTLVCSAKAGGVDLPLTQAMACVFILNLGLAIPLTVANVGVFEASLGFALSTSVLGLGLEHALGIATLEHFVKIAGLLGGVGFLHLLKFDRVLLPAKNLTFSR